MKTTAPIILLSMCMTLAVSAQVGIGTTTPNNNAILDLTTTDKALLLPRLTDTNSVNNPTSGMLIYDLNAKSPAVHDGNRWSPMALMSAMTSTSINDSITYEVSGPGSTYFTTSSFEVLSLSEGGSNVAAMLLWTELNFSKGPDSNSVGFLKSMTEGLLIGQIEFKIYEAGAMTPYFSVKLTNWKVTSAQFGVSAEGMIESLSLTPEIIAFKDWVIDFGFSYDLDGMIVGPY